MNRKSELGSRDGEPLSCGVTSSESGLRPPTSHFRPPTSHFRSRAFWLVAFSALLIAGCVSAGFPVSRGQGISEKRRERTRVVARQFDRKRDLAEFEAARTLWIQGDSDGAAEALELLLARNPDHIEARLLMAELLLSDNRQSEAIAYLEPATIADPDDARVQHMMGLLLDSIGKTDAALAYYEKAKSLCPDDELYAVSYQTLSASDEESDRPPDGTVVSLSGESLPSVGDNDAAPHGQAAADPNGSCPSLLPVPGQDSADSLPQPTASPLGPASSHCDDSASCTIRIIDNPEPVAAFPSVGHLRCPTEWAGDAGAGRGSLDAAGPPVGQCECPDELPAPERISADGAEATDSDGRHDPADDPISGSASEWLAKGLSAMSKGMGALALAYFQQATALKPDDPQIPISAAISALRHNQPDVAVVLLEPSLERFPDSAAACRILGAAHYRLGDYESSQVTLQQALSLDKSSALSYFLMGCTLVKLGRPAAAETHFRQAGRLDPKYALRR